MKILDLGSPFRGAEGKKENPVETGFVSTNRYNGRV